MLRKACRERAEYAVPIPSNQFDNSRLRGEKDVSQAGTMHSKNDGSLREDPNLLHEREPFRNNSFETKSSKKSSQFLIIYDRTPPPFASLYINSSKRMD